MPGPSELSGGVRIFSSGDARSVGAQGSAVGGLLVEVKVVHVAEPQSGRVGRPVVGSEPVGKVDGRKFWSIMEEILCIVNSFGVAKHVDL
jgi:hypothetical protein